MEFPIYRKYPNHKSFFKITSDNRFEELKITGKKVDHHEFVASIFPDMQLIQDMIAMVGGYWELSSAEEFEGRL